MKLKKNVWIPCVVILFLIVGFGTYFSKVQFNNFDFTVLSFVRKTIYPNLFFQTLTKLGNTSSYVIIILLMVPYLISKKNYKFLSAILFAVLFATLCMIVFKNIFQRQRPQEFFVIMEDGFSYPSGHASVSAAFYWTIARIFNNDKKSKIAIGVFIAIPFLIGLSRLVLGVHWPTDVIIGWSLGFAVSLIGKEIYLNFGEKKNE